MNIDIIIIALWGMCIIFSWIGYGTLIENLLFSVKNRRAGIWLRSGWGLSITIIFGGILNLVNLIKPPVLIIYIFVGIGIYLYQLLKYKNINRFRLPNSWKSTSNPLNIIFMLIIALLLLRYLSALYSIHFNWHDDFHAYIAYPIKMIQTGSLGEDPFSYRRLLSLSGMSFLHTLTLSIGKINNLKLIDSGIGSILICGLIMDFKKYLKISIGWLFIIILVFLLIVPYGGNLTSVLTGTVLFLTMFQTILFINNNKYQYSFKNALLLSIIIAGLASLKSTFIIPTALIMASIFILSIFNRNPIKIKQIFAFLLIPFLSIMLLLPWMISNFNSNGSMLYPIFGRGYHGSTYGTWEQSSGNFSILGTIKWIPTILTNPYILIISILVLFLIFRKKIFFTRFWFPIVLFITLLSTIILIITQTGGYGWDRYSWPFLMSVLLFLLIVFYQYKYNLNSINILVKSVITIIVLAVVFIVNGNELLIYLNNQITIIKNINQNEPIKEIDGGIEYNQIDQQEYIQYKKMQDFVPENEILLTRLRYPFLLDFQRNKILLLDYPGGSSPPPGIPSFQGSIKLVNYLRDANIRYIAYSYNSQANFKYEDLNSRLTGYNSLVKMEAKHTFDFQNNLNILGDKYKRIYDDGEIFVLDLNILK